jgi:hypothetical protein
MKRFFFSAVLCAALFLSVASAHAAEVPVVAWIYDGDVQTGLAGASFAISSQSDDPGQTILTTDETGRLVFRDLADGTYYLHQTEAPGLYRPLKEPLCLQLSADGMRVDGRAVDEVSVLHRSGRPVMIAAAMVLSLLPMVLRLIWLHYRGK